MKTPYNTGKVKIGSRYTPPPTPMTRDEERIQAALLGDSAPRVSWLWIILAIIAAAFMVAMK